MSIRLDALLLAAHVGGNLSSKQPKLLGKNRVKTVRCQAFDCLKQYHNYSDMKDHMSSAHKGQTPSRTSRSPLTAPSLSSVSSPPVVLSPVPMASSVSSPPAVLSPVPMAVVDYASQPLKGADKRSYRDAIAQPAVFSEALPSATPKSVPQKSVNDNMILSPESAGWIYVGRQCSNAEDAYPNPSFAGLRAINEMAPVNFLSHDTYSDLVSAQKFVDEHTEIDAMLSGPDIEPHIPSVHQMMSHRSVSGNICI